jgi:hypothetical protein
MATNFTTKNPGMPPTRTKPGKMGEQAAAKGVKSGSQKGGLTDAHGPSRGGVTSPSRLTAQGSGGASAAPPPEQSDFRHAIIAAQYENMRRLGRDIPFGVSLILNGHHRDILEEGKRPFDLFLDA